MGMSKINSGVMVLGRLQTGTRSEGINPDVKREIQLQATFIPFSA